MFLKTSNGSRDCANLIKIDTTPHWQYMTLWLCCFNAQSVVGNCNNKRVEIEHFVHDESVNILLLTETWLRCQGDEGKCVWLQPVTPCDHSPTPHAEGAWLCLYTTVSTTTLWSTRRSRTITPLLKLLNSPWKLPSSSVCSVYTDHPRARRMSPLMQFSTLNWLTFLSTAMCLVES